jgi:hypothetical protein
MFAGTLDTVSVTEVLGLMAKRGKSGALHLWGPSTGVVELLEGDVAFATARADDDLGSELVRVGFLTEDDWQEAIVSADAARHVAGVLRRRGVDPGRLHAHVRKQTEEAIWELDRWWGEFSFEPTSDDPLAGAFRHPIPSLLVSVRRRDSAWVELQKVVPSTDHLIATAPVTPGDDEELTLSRSQYRLLTSVDGTRSVAQLAADLGGGLFRTCELVAGLVQAGLLVVQERSTEPAVVAGTRVAAHERVLVGAGGGAFEPAPIDLAVGPVPAAGPSYAGYDPAPAGVAPSAPAPAGGAGLPGVEFVSHREQPARDLILRLLSAVKEL